MVLTPVTSPIDMASALVVSPKLGAILGNRVSAILGNRESAILPPSSFVDKPPDFSLPHFSRAFCSGSSSGSGESMMATGGMLAPQTPPVTDKKRGRVFGLPKVTKPYCCTILDCPFDALLSPSADISPEQALHLNRHEDGLILCLILWGVMCLCVSFGVRSVVLSGRAV